MEIIFTIREPHEGQWWTLTRMVWNQYDCKVSEMLMNQVSLRHDNMSYAFNTENLPPIERRLLGIFLREQVTVRPTALRRGDNAIQITFKEV